MLKYYLIKDINDFSLLVTLIIIFSKKHNKTLEEQFNIDSFVPVRGLLAAIIVFTHAWINGIYNNTFFDSFVGLYSRARYLVVSVFFFLSGFGVYESAKRRDHYFDGFIKRESIKIMLPYVLTNIIYIVFRLIKSDTIVLKEVLLSFI
jgi:peptidoglycan/LPS O-acetylase OafA/YrhL